MSRRVLALLRLLGGLLVLGVLVWRFGTGPFDDAWRVTTWGSVAGALLLTGLATVANAWRWRVIAHALGVPLTPAGSVAAYYRSQFLNATLPGGVLGDAHRGVRHGRDAGDLGAGLRATVWDRVTGQLVQAALLVVALVVVPTPLRVWAPVVGAGLGAVALLTAWLARRAGSIGVVGDDVRLLLRPAVGGRVVAASCASTAAHAAVFLVAVSAVGVDASPGLLATIALAVLVGSAVPLNVAGWGPREGITAGIFALAGLGSSTGLTVSIVFGVLAAVATVPGLLVLLADTVLRRRRKATLSPTRELEEARRG
ncbi:MAG TPA: lysylphosphatidylglycerol synthase transmembrane domain-containing protein [Nocardioides sp.]|uniref:lysylphosphatidylglycerol synthase transmembrane domain-containing protein n=1 Tax=Nocardioides sp. TaxID=35761 RepID=UPI002F3F3378